MKLIIPAVLVIMFFSAKTVAQSTFTTSYTINFPLGNTHDYIEKTSFRGFSLDYRYLISGNIALGIGTGWYTFYEKKEYDTYTSKDNALSISGQQYRYINSMPILAVGNYYFKPEEKLSPFVGLGIGTFYNVVTTDLGQYSFETRAWQFCLAPEAGVRIKFEVVSGFLSLRYNNNFESTDLDGQSFLSLNIGLMYGK
jgi:opacity protein-like surface antigen